MNTHAFPVKNLPNLSIIKEGSKAAFNSSVRELISTFSQLPKKMDKLTSMTDCFDPEKNKILRKNKSYILVGISGFGTKREGRGEPSGAHDNLPNHSSISSTYRLTHRMNKKEIKSVLNNFECPRGISSETDPKLIIMVNSWGALAGKRLASKYKKKCGEQVDLFVMIDGVLKPTPLPYTKTPPSKKCINYYQQSSSLRGSKLNNCENKNLSKNCSQKEKKDYYHCHITVEWDGTRDARNEILDYINSSR